ncbi:MAG: GNAT family N-acetyltransferase [Solirubrobacteraceae bacterium]|nr:GNAT family N-acetyltransferase [Patulibacter sp.]
MTTPLHAVPQYPASVRITSRLWAALRAVFAANQPVLAELASFWTMFLWHGQHRVRVSQVDGFLVVRFAVEPLEAMVVALPGATVTAAVVEALDDLIGVAALRYLSAATVRALAPYVAARGLHAIASPDDADYVFSVECLAALRSSDPATPGRKLGKAKEARALDEAGGAQITERRLSDPAALDHLLATYDRWTGAKFDGAPSPAIVQEHDGMLRWPRGPEADALTVFCMSIDDQPIGVSVVESAWNRTWLGLLFKTDRGVEGSTAYLRRHVARRALDVLGPAGRLSIGQDDGVPGLRTGKRAYGPLPFEPKFALRPSGS